MKPNKYNDTVSLFAEFTEEQIDSAIVDLQERQMMYVYARQIKESGERIEANIPKVKEITHKLKLNFMELSNLLGYLNKSICRHLEYTEGEAVSEEDISWYNDSVALEKKLEKYSDNAEFTQDEADYINHCLDSWHERDVKANSLNDDWLNL